MDEQPISKEEFRELLMNSPKWVQIQEAAIAAAYAGLAFKEVDNSPEMIVQGVVRVGGRAEREVDIFHLTFIIGATQ